MTKDMNNALEFAKRHNQWHSFASDKKTTIAIKSLEKKGLVKVNEFNQFKKA